MEKRETPEKRKKKNTAARRRSRRIRGKWNRIRGITLTGILAFFFLVGLIFFARPKRSVTEKRELAKFPKISSTGLMDGSFWKGVEKWYGDTYPLRSPLISGYAKLENLSGVRTSAVFVSGNDRKADEIPDTEKAKPAPVVALPASATDASQATESRKASQDQASATLAAAIDKADENLPDGTLQDEPEVAGTIYVADGAGFSVYRFSRSGADAYASMVNTVKATLGDEVNVYDILAPTAFGVMLPEETQKELGGSSEQEAFRYISGRLDPDVRYVDVITSLKKHNAEYIYFRTDHHWTQRGAYYAYRQFCKARETKPHELSEYQETTYDNFLGSFYASSGQSPELKKSPDEVETYQPLSTNEMEYTDRKGNVYSWPIINDVTNYPASEKYSAFAAGDNPYAEIHNPKLHNSSSCVLIKESYGNAFLPFLTDHFETIYEIDYRYYTGSVRQLMEEKGINNVILLNNAEAIGEERAQRILSLFR